MTVDDSISRELILNKIFELRGRKVMLSSDLASMYKVETRVLNQQVKRNIGRFPERYMFQLTKEEHDSLRSQNVILKRGRHSKYPPNAFTEHGILMLSSVLRSERAEKVNLLIIDTFVELNNMLLVHKDILLELKEVQKHLSEHDDSIDVIMKSLRQFMESQKVQKSRREIGFKQKGKG